jgi:hypothetical protein
MSMVTFNLERRDLIGLIATQYSTYPFLAWPWAALPQAPLVEQCGPRRPVKH